MYGDKVIDPAQSVEPMVLSGYVYNVGVQGNALFRPMAPNTAALDTCIESEEIDMDALGSDQRRAMRARRESMVVVPQTDADGECIGMYDVHSQSGSHYVVVLDHERGCDCPDTKFNHAENCKHRRRVAMQITETDCPAPGQQIGDYGTTLEEVRQQLEREREQILGELDSLNEMIDGFEG